MKGEESSRRRDWQGDQHPVVEGLEHHPERFGLFPRAKAVSSEFLKKGGDLFLVVEKDFSFLNKETATLISNLSNLPGGADSVLAQHFLK